MERLREAARDSELLLVAASRAGADELARAAASPGLHGVHRFTLAQLAAVLAAHPMAGRGLAPISGLAAEALAARITHELLNAGKLAYFNPVATMPGFARALASTLVELRLAESPLPELSHLGDSGADLAAFALAYERELERRSLADLAVIFRLATDVAQSGEHRFARLPVVLLDARIETRAQRDFLAALIRHASAVFAASITQDAPALAALSEMLAVDPQSIDPGAGAALDRVRAQLFSIDRAAGPADASFEFFSAPGEGLECVEIARRIRALAAEGVPLDDIAILLRNPDRYQPMVEEALRRAGIPGYFSRGTVRPDPAGRAFLALLACAAEGCSATRFAEYLSLGQVPALDESGAPPRKAARWVAPDDEVLAALHTSESQTAEEGEDNPALALPFGWEKLLVDAAVVGGRGRWERRLRGLEKELRLQLAQIDLDDEHRGHLARQLDRLTYLERFALPLIDALAGLPKSATWGEWIEQLAALAAMALRHTDAVIALLNELQPMGEIGPVDLEEVSLVLAERLRFLRREPPPRRYGGVFAGAIDAVRGRSFRVVFLPGLAEGLFPRRPTEDPLLLDECRRALDGSLATRNDRVARERLLLHIAAASAGERLVVSYPRMDVAQARARVPSFYAMEVVSAAEGRLPDLRDFEKRAARAASARLGWPAPDDAGKAIDDAEFDLAMLGAARHLPRETAKGAVRYLVQVNENLGRSLRARGRRWRGRWWPEDGLVDPDTTAAALLAGHRLAARAYSPSALQHYAACPYRFFLSAIHQLRRREDPVALEQLDPLTRGLIFHAVQFEFYRALEAAPLPENGGARIQAILDLLDAVLDRVAARFEEDLAPAIPRVWKGEIEDLRRDLRGWLHHAPAEWKPIRYEFAFGSVPGAERDPRSVAEEAVIFDGIRLRGSIDVIERNTSTHRLRVTDHKTGKPPDPAPKWIGGGAALQPVLYALAAEKLAREPVYSGRLFYATERGGYSEIDIPLDDRAREYTRRALATIDAAVGEGFLPAAPAAEACDLCDYRAVCGPYEETRVARKSSARLQALVELRGIP